MGRCKSAGSCFICNNDCLAYDDYSFFTNWLDKEKKGSVLICFGMDSDRTGGIYYPTNCYKNYIQLCLQKNLDYLNIEYTPSAAALGGGPLI